LWQVIFAKLNKIALFLAISFVKITVRAEIMQTDQIDRRILRQLLTEPEMAVKALSDHVGVTVATCARRLEKLREAGILRAQTARIDWRRLGYEVEVSLRFTLDKADPRAFDQFLEAARDVPEVIAIETFLGRVDVRLNLVARDMAHYAEVYRSRILSLPHIADIEALMLIATIKDGEGLPL
jgi:Lrp/AsnC family transcriptional regulator